MERAQSRPDAQIGYVANEVHLSCVQIQRFSDSYNLRIESSYVLSSLQFSFIIIILYFISNVIVLEYWPLLLAVALPSALLASHLSAENCLCIVITPGRSLL